MRLLMRFAALVVCLGQVNCQHFQTSDFELIVRLPASGDCFGLHVMSGNETRYPAAECEQIVRRAIMLTSENWRMLKTDIQTNCQFDNTCTQIQGAADSLFLTMDKALNKLP